VAIGRIVQKDHEHIVAIQPKNGGAIMRWLFWADEIVADGDVETPELKAEEIELGKRLVERYTRPIDLSQFSDLYEEKIDQLITARLNGKEAPIEQIVEETKPDLLKAFEQELETMAVAVPVGVPA